MTRTYGAIAIPVGGTTSLTLTIGNSGGFVEVLPAGLVVADPNRLRGTCTPLAAVTATPGGSTVDVGNLNVPQGSSCTVIVDVRGVREGLAGPLFVGSAFQVRYSANLAAGDSMVNMTNAASADGNICVNVYTFAPDEQLVACCSCVLTPNALASMGTRSDMTGLTLTPAVPTAVTVALVATHAREGLCNPAVTITAERLAPGLAAYGTTLHAQSPGSYMVAETPFTPSSLSAAQMTRMTALCGFIQANGSGYGICRSCRMGGAGAIRQ